VPYTLPDAAIATGRDRSTILRAIRSGKLSATRDPATRGWLVEPAELARVYGALAGIGAAHAGDEPSISDAVPNMRLMLEVERTKSAGLEAMLTAEQAKIVLLERTVDDLRRRLDVATEQLGEAWQQVRLLTDQREKSPVGDLPAATTRRWWPWRSK
jgi:hypothetical protein